MSETLVMEPTEEMTATQVMPAEGQVAVQTAEQYVELPIADAPEPEQEPSVPETQAEEPAAKVPDAGTDENSNSIDVEIENMVWEVEDADPAEDDNLHRIVEEEMAEEEPVYDDYQDHSYRPDYNYGRRPVRAFNKHLYTWVFSFLCGMYGVDRFCRGQIALGVLKLLTFGGFGLWYLADVIIAMTKSYMGDYSDEDNLLFDQYGRFVK